MRPLLKALAVCLLLCGAWALLCPAALAQAYCELPPLWDFPSFASQQLNQHVTGTHSITLLNDPDVFILVEDFEYSDNLCNHGWRSSPSGNSAGECSCCLNDVLGFETFFDSRLGSSVLEANRLSDYLSNDPYEKSPIYHDLSTPPSADTATGLDYIDLSSHPILSFDFRLTLNLGSPPGSDIDTADIFECTILGTTRVGYDVTVRILPDPEDQPSDRHAEGTQWGGTDAIRVYRSAVTNPSQESFQVTVYMDTAMVDTDWHTVVVDVSDAVRNAVDGCEGTPEKEDWYMTKARVISLEGVRIRIDHIGFVRKRLPEGISNPDLFELGPLYAQVFEHYRYLFMADYEVPEGIIKITDLILDQENFLFAQNPDNPDDPVVRYWTDLGADPARFGKEADPTISGIMGRAFIVDLNLPIFSDPGLRLTNTGPGPSAKAIIDSAALDWYVRVNNAFEFTESYDSMNMHRLPIYPYDGMPTYLPAHYDAMGQIKAFGKPFFTPDMVFRLEAALWNAGVTVWPNIVALEYTPECFEDPIITMAVTDGVHWDTREFPVIVVNYPMENYPPVVQVPIKDQTFAIGRVNEYIVNFIDPDCFIFSLSQPPATTHRPGFPVSNSYRTDMDGLTWSVCVNGLPHYVYDESWIEEFIQPNSGLIHWVPEFQGAFDTIIICTEVRGGVAFAELTIICRHIPVVQISDIMAQYYPIAMGYPLQVSAIGKANSSIVVSPLINLYGPHGGLASGIPAQANQLGTSLMWPPVTRYPNLQNSAILNPALGFSGGLDSSGISNSVLWGMVMPWWAF